MEITRSIDIIRIRIALASYINQMKNEALTANVVRRADLIVEIYECTKLKAELEG